MTAIIKILDELTAPGQLYESLDERKVHCHACAHRCLIQPDKRGVCKMRYNQDGILRVPWGYVVSAQTDPIEKKPFAHLLPGSDVLTFGMLGCNFHCSFCQNWQTSQTLRDPSAGLPSDYIQRVTPEQLVNYALQTGAQIIASSYNEPLITSEWSVDIFKLAQQKGLLCAYVSNGYATAEVLNYLHPFLNAFKVDLKTMQDRHYRDVGGVLKHVLDSIQLAHKLGFWVEVVTLVIPGFNDSVDELWDAARFLVSVSPDIPWHVTAYHPDYQMTDNIPTPVSTLQKAAEVGQEAGLHYVYAGNLPGRVGSLEDTFCPACQAPLIRRRGYTIFEYHITSKGTCPKCHAHIAGIWTDKPESVRIGNWGIPRRAKI